MSWTYSGEPGSSPKDAVRFEIQDTDEEAQLLQDGEIEYAIAQEALEVAEGEALSEGGLYASSARCCEVLARLFAMQANETSGSIKTSFDEQARTYSERAQELRAKAQGHAAPSSPSEFVSNKRALRENRNRVQPLFRRGQFRNRQYGGPGDGLPPNP